MGDFRKLRPLGRLLAALEEEQVRFILIEMSAAIAQGVMGTTLDVDLWIDLPSRRYMQVQNLARRLGATPAANTVVYLNGWAASRTLCTLDFLRNLNAANARRAFALVSSLNPKAWNARYTGAIERAFGGTEC